MGTYRLLTYDADGTPTAGVLVDGRVHPAAVVLQDVEVDASSVLALLASWTETDAALAQAADELDPADGQPLGAVVLLAPILYPNAYYCAAANFRDHMRAMAVKLRQDDEPDPRELDIKPFHFVLPGRSCTSGPYDPIVLPRHGTKIDWEIELAAVIGRPAKDVPVASALDYVAGYMVGNDVSVRDMQYLKIPNVGPDSLFRSDFIAMKGWDGACAIGPWLTPARDVADPQRLAMRTWIDGDLMQDSSTAEMVFSTAEQISYLSERVTLLPGDVVLTGTPAGTGMESDRFLKEGETVRMTIDGLGELVQPVVR